ncbi:class I SAM-dependent methyltransferase [Heliophilum fasciatum]|uniref:tRNA (Cmo5U34)-methyltransferase n=1 Tax=Heliophilum fasciatum TaxID=35700 RepID=A0A4R2RMY4_9FIRM|nr:class I SAM-dependent methyltransferase [Heliophilum fasciatum]MCW2277986.1 tRNA (cmo5U34)-methyltransferase [Heliophilum fasciatum]TCP64394.1 tRNA (cmo5U34)-methyltransferase [Heliophilum fasciatum]
MHTQKESLQHKFNACAQEYDGQRQQLIPCFDDFYSIAVALANTKKPAPKILDIGAGTGLLSAFLLEVYPDAELTLIDIAENMLDIAKKRFQGRPNITYIAADYTQYSFPEKYDVAISSLSIHHLTGPEKQKLYQQIYDTISDNGLFINADQVQGATPWLETTYMSDWRAKVEASGLSAAEIHAAYERQKLDKMSPLDDQLTWLRQAGFRDVDCMYKYYNFVVLFGRKQ